uniref:Uncharacterized protein n=1 Tax=Rhizophora mucronata TaxID=61149 RepID=A0A2P2P674_RHIMU
MQMHQALLIVLSSVSNHSIWCQLCPNMQLISHPCFKGRLLHHLMVCQP